MSHRSVVLVPADRATNVERLKSVAMVFAPGAEIHVLDVTPKARPWHARQDRQGNPWAVTGTASPRTEAVLSANQAGTIRHVHLQGTDERIIAGYAQLTGASAIVVDRHYGTSSLWRNTAVVTRMSRMSPVPVLAVPSGGRALQRWAAGDITRVLAAVDSTIASAIALRTSIGLARRHGARVTMLHALENFPGRSVYSGGEAWRLANQLPAQQRQIAKQLESQAREFGGADAAAQVITGDAALGIAVAASEIDAGVIVMGVSPRTWLDRSVFGSTLGRVLRRTEIPVLIIPVIGGNKEWCDARAAAHIIHHVPAHLAGIAA